MGLKSWAIAPLILRLIQHSAAEPFLSFSLRVSFGIKELCQSLLLALMWDTYTRAYSMQLFFTAYSEGFRYSQVPSKLNISAHNFANHKYQQSQGRLRPSMGISSRGKARFRGSVAFPCIPSPLTAPSRPLTILVSSVLALVR